MAYLALCSFHYLYQEDMERSFLIDPEEPAEPETDVTKEKIQDTYSAGVY